MSFSLLSLSPLPPPLASLLNYVSLISPSNVFLASFPPHLIPAASLDHPLPSLLNKIPSIAFLPTNINAATPAAHCPLYQYTQCYTLPYTSPSLTPTPHHHYNVSPYTSVHNPTTQLPPPKPIPQLLHLFLQEHNAPSCPLITGPLRHYVLNVLWIVTNVLVVLLTVYHLWKLYRDLSTSSLEAVRIASLVTTMISVTQPRNQGTKGGYEGGREWKRER